MANTSPTTQQTHVKILRYILEYVNAHQYAPSLADIGQEIFCEQTTAYYHVGKLRQYGLIDWLDNQPRTYHVTPAGLEKLNAQPAE